MDDFKEGRSFAKRMYGPRSIGTLLCGFIIVFTIHSSLSSFTLVLLALNSLVWAHVAYRISIFSKEPFRAEKRNFLFDSFFCGFWIALMCLKPTPSATIFSMVAMNNIAIGGPKLLIKGIGLKVLGFFVAVCFFGFTFETGTASDMWLCLPLVIVYPVVLGFAFYKLAFELKESKSKLRSLSRTDPLTGLLNRGYWNDVVSASLVRPKSIERSTVVIIDVDRFKSVNDMYGHAAGDELLRVLAKLLKSKLREGDAICRYGGDEFCVFISDTAISVLMARMHEICIAFAIECESSFPGAHATLSVGVAPWGAEAFDVDAWISIADNNLYKAKREGRNKIVCGFPEVEK
ncbi:diguanylate cyclase [Pseudomonas sp. MAFF 311096]|uniref:diguanylate cyclase n=1 Tax=Pseudomonas petroselini TaxID=2899822 RepID=A0ABS8QW85_9PSED|nr:diguanylate cyclase [Pseudomonas petroselini]MCD7039653.1 diguanylate cyclase [Pseudomonas petroselini]MCD7043303.1 diguanylate cyclase [Pseudomonas petroselini]MCD7067100.1 diguanylate cyclase [Pseudomonas petroselini]